MNLKQLIPNIALTKKPNLFFLHIPKTGGSSIDYAIGKHYRHSFYHIDPKASYEAAHQIYHQQQSILRLREYLTYIQMLRGTQYISGHVSFGREIWDNFGDCYLYLTVLRNPVKRFISHFFYNSYKESNHCQINSDLETYLDSPTGKRAGCEYVKFIGGVNEQHDYRSSSSIQQAIDNLSKFQIIGFLEDLETFKTKFEAQSGCKLNIPHRRKNPISKTNIAPSLFAEITTICQPDMEIYQYAKEHFN